MAEIFDGKKQAEKLEEEIKRKIGDIKKKLGVTPKLVSIIVGDNQAFHLYLSLVEEKAKKAGILFEKKSFTSQTSPKQIYKHINSLNQDRGVHGIVVQMPLPKNFDPIRLGSQISPEKDVDCLTPESLKHLVEGQPIFLPAVVKAVLLILEKKRIKLRGKDVAVVGASGFVGKPLAAHLKNLGVTVIPCDEFTKNLKEWTKKGEILVSATGVSGLIKKEMVKKGAVVIDLGSPKPEVNFEEVKKIASFITPVPGGVGPLTIVCLLENVLLAARRQVKR